MLRGNDEQHTSLERYLEAIRHSHEVDRLLVRQQASLDFGSDSVVEALVATFEHVRG